MHIELPCRKTKHAQQHTLVSKPVPVTMEKQTTPIRSRNKYSKHVTNGNRTVDWRTMGQNSQILECLKDFLPPNRVQPLPTGLLFTCLRLTSHAVCQSLLFKSSLY